MSSRLIIAGAGSGKTTWLVYEALKISKERVLITTFTDANEQGIREKLFELHGCIPANVTVMTWFSFLLRHGVKPYQSVIYENRIRGMLLVNQKSGFKYKIHGQPIYYGEKEIEPFYFSKSKKIYSDKIAKFVFRANEKTNGLVVDRICRIFPNIFIDEVQDMAGYDLEIIRLLNATAANLLMVGDPRQVTYHTHDEAMNKNYGDGSIARYLKEKCKTAIVDETSLNVSYRNNPIICALANLVFPNHPRVGSNNHTKTGHDGVFLVSPNDVDLYISKYHPIQLRDNRMVPVSSDAPATNFGNAKGLTFDRVLIYPTKPMLEWIKDHNYILKPQSRARLYVAVTRAKYSVAFVDETIDFEDNEIIKRWKSP